MAINFLGKNIIKREKETFEKLNAKDKSDKINDLTSSELDTIIYLEASYDDKITDEFIKLQNLPKGGNVEKILVDNRKKVMKKLLNVIQKMY